ncbi:hypothetical protein PCANB_002904 [Pneumocystis canis]|nr:hypothetical protein PCANB_002904 [Pneumocystis canis]
MVLPAADNTNPTSLKTPLHSQRTTRTPFQNVSLNNDHKRLLSTPALRVARYRSTKSSSRSPRSVGSLDHSDNNGNTMAKMRDNSTHHYQRKELSSNTLRSTIKSKISTNTISNTLIHDNSCLKTHSMTTRSSNLSKTTNNYHTIPRTRNETSYPPPVYLTAKLSNMRITTPSHCKDVKIPIVSDTSSSCSSTPDDYTETLSNQDETNPTNVSQDIFYNTFNISRSPSILDSPLDTTHLCFKQTKPLSHVIAYLDIRTADQSDANLSFKCLLIELGACVKEHWEWSIPNPSDTSNPFSNTEDDTKSQKTKNTFAFQNIGITHVIWRLGSLHLLEKVKAANNYLERIHEIRKIHCVSINWIMKCEEEDRHVDEAKYEINLESNLFSQKRASINPKTLIPSNISISESQNTPTPNAPILLPNTSTSSTVLSPVKKTHLSTSKTVLPKPFTELERCGLIAAKKKIDFHKPIVSSPLAKRCWTFSE